MRLLQKQESADKIKRFQEENERKTQKFDEDRDYLAKDLGWYKNDDNTWTYLFLKSKIYEHPIKPEVEYIKSLLPRYWKLREDDIYLMAEYQGTDKSLFPDVIIVGNTSAGYYDYYKYDICNLIVQVRKYINTIKVKMNDNQNEKDKYQYIPAWICPKCGTTHPITVQSCCQKDNFYQPYKPIDFPSTPSYPDHWQWPRWICKV
jgi:hypothetical protein